MQVGHGAAVGREWTFEIKLDGYRCIAVKRAKDVMLFSRYQKVPGNSSKRKTPVKIAILHGPNLDRLGKREPEIYGRATLKDLEKLIRTEARRLGFSTVYFQSAHEGALIDRIHALTGGASTPSSSISVPTRTPASPCTTPSRPPGCPPSRCTYRISKNANHSAGNP